MGSNIHKPDRVAPATRNEINLAWSAVRLLEKREFGAILECHSQALSKVLQHYVAVLHAAGVETPAHVAEQAAGFFTGLVNDELQQALGQQAFEDLARASLASMSPSICQEYERVAQMRVQEGMCLLAVIKKLQIYHGVSHARILRLLHADGL